MNLFSFMKHYTFAKKWQKKEKSEHYLVYNNEEIEKSRVIVFQMHHDAYKNLRAFKTPQYDTYYLMRKKKGFNTLFFRQNYDVIIADHNGKILDLLTDVKPGFFSEYYDDAHYIYFAPVGTINHYNFVIKGTIRIGRYLFRDVL